MNQLALFDDGLATRFHARYTPVTESGCWLWEGYEHGNNGYGSFTIKNRRVLAHRMSWILHFGPIPHNKLVLHRCDTPTCVNPSHLYLGDQFTNMQDMARKGRQWQQRRRNEFQARG